MGGKKPRDWSRDLNCDVVGVMSRGEVENSSSGVGNDGRDSDKRGARSIEVGR